MDLIIRNAKLTDHNSLVDIAIKEGIFQQINENIPFEAEKEIEAKGQFVIPPFVESHIHLDSALSVHHMPANESGTLLEAINLWDSFTDNLTKTDTYERAKKAVEWLVVQGVQHIRAHTDCTESSLQTMQAILQLKEDMQSLVDIQVVAFPQNGLFLQDDAVELIEKAVQMGADVIGGLPQAEITREDGIKQIAHIFDLAKKYNKTIDIHTDETTDDQSRFLEVIAKYTLQYKMQNRVTASHTTALHQYNNDYAAKVIQNVKRAGVHIVTNPFSNALLQNRLDGYPKSRGTTRVDELLANSVNVSIGNDNMMDPFGPLGKGNVLQAAHLLAHTAHLSSEQQLNQLFQMITRNGAKTLQITDDYGIKVGNTANCIILQATSIAEAIRLISDCLYVIRKGIIIATTEPAIRNLVTEQSTKQIHFTNT
ncbi:MAG TPA: amidohydrolase family protein [Pseudogracilibacillus sp.]|nr:amidohydrolase family protein [Pseudogracilibacillus sp.]